MGTTSDGYLVGGAALPTDHPSVRVLPTQAARDLGYSSQRLVHALVRAAETVTASHPGSPLYLGNLSRQAGGDIPWSVSHNSGRDADVAFYLLDSAGDPTARSNLVKLDRNGWAFDAQGAMQLDAPRTWTFVAALLSDPTIVVQYLFVARALKRQLLARGRREGASPALLARVGKVLVQPRGKPPHDDHLHLRIHCGPIDAAHGCRETGPRREGAPAVEAIAAEAGGRALTTLGSRDPAVRRAALHRIGLLGHRAGARPAARSLSDPFRTVRARAAQTLVDLGATPRAAALARAVRSETDPATQLTLAWALVELAPDRIANGILPVLDRPERLPSGRLLRAEAAALVADAEAAAGTPHLVDLLVDPETAVRAAARQALARLSNIDLGLDHPRWSSWWKTHRDEPRDAWVAEGFRVAGYDVGPTVTDASIPALLDAVASAEPHLSENARKALQRLLGKRARGHLMWPPSDAAWYWRVVVRRRRK